MDKVNWQDIRCEAEKKFNREFSTSYLQGIYFKRLTSKKIKEWLDKRLGPATETPATAA
jgi:hypothetical protein